MITLISLKITNRPLLLGLYNVLHIPPIPLPYRNVTASTETLTTTFFLSKLGENGSSKGFIAQNSRRSLVERTQHEAKLEESHLKEPIVRVQQLWFYCNHLP